MVIGEIPANKAMILLVLFLTFGNTFGSDHCPEKLTNVTKDQTGTGKPSRYCTVCNFDTFRTIYCVTRAVS